MGLIDSRQPLLITGASGFVGEHLARIFTGRGERVAGTYLTTQPDTLAVELIPFEITDPRAAERILPSIRPRAIIHCAAKTKLGWCEENLEESHAVNVEGTEALCRAVAAQIPETPVVFFSTDLVFNGEEPPYGERANPKPISRYGSQKTQAEKAVLKLERGMVLRSALVYGHPTSRAHSFLSWVVNTLMKEDGELPAFEDEHRTPVFVGDLAEAVELLLEAEPEFTAGKIFHAGGGERLSRVKMAEWVCEVFELPRSRILRSRREEIPGGHIRPADVSLRSERLLSLGWTQISFRDGLIQCRENWESFKPRPFGPPSSSS